MSPGNFMSRIQRSWSLKCDLIPECLSSGTSFRSVQDAEEVSASRHELLRSARVVYGHVRLLINVDPRGGAESERGRLSGGAACLVLRLPINKGWRKHSHPPSGMAGLSSAVATGYLRHLSDSIQCSIGTEMKMAASPHVSVSTLLKAVAQRPNVCQSQVALNS